MSTIYVIRATESPDTISVTAIADSGSHTWSVDREEADPEHRFTEYRLAAGYFGNLPATRKEDR